MCVSEVSITRRVETRTFLNVVDRCSGLQQMIEVENQQAVTLREKYRSGWRRHYGPPVDAVSDSARALSMGLMAAIFGNDATNHEAAAGEAHQDNSHAGRHGGWFERSFNHVLSPLLGVAKHG